MVEERFTGYSEEKAGEIKIVTGAPFEIRTDRRNRNAERGIEEWRGCTCVQDDDDDVFN